MIDKLVSHNFNKPIKTISGGKKAENQIIPHYFELCRKSKR